MLMVRDKGFYTRLLRLAAPMVLQSVITLSVSLADNIMVGRLGELALSGVFVSNQVQNILHMFVMGLTAAMLILGSQHWGRRQTDKVKTIIGIAFKFGVGAGSVLLLVTLVAPTGVLKLFSDEAAVLTEAQRYLVIIRYTYLFFCVTQVLIASMRCVERVRIGMYLSIMTFIVNVSLNWILIFGNLGAPALGIRGAAIATLSARVLETLVMIVYVRFVDTKLRIRFREMLRSERVLLKRFFRYGLPVIAGNAFWGINLAAQGAIVGRLGATALASVSIANVVSSIMGVVVYGTAGATGIIIGQTVGAGEYDRVRAYTKTLQILFIGVGLISGAALMLVRDNIGLVYALDPATMALTRQFLLVLSVTIVGTAYQMSCLTGIVRAGGATHFVLVNDLIWILGFVLPASAIATFVFHAPPIIVFALLKSDQILKCMVAVIKVNRFRWIKNLTLEKPESVSI
jgi:putative MATE family efflux protein